MLARKVRELGVLMTYHTCTVLHKDKVSEELHPKFVPKVVSDFHINQRIHLPVFYPQLFSSKGEEAVWHSLDVHRALAFCLHRIRLSRKSSKLFCLIHGLYERRGHFLPEAVKMDFRVHPFLL